MIERRITWMGGNRTAYTAVQVPMIAGLMRARACASLRAFPDRRAAHGWRRRSASQSPASRSGFAVSRAGAAQSQSAPASAPRWGLQAAGYSRAQRATDDNIIDAAPSWPSSCHRGGRRSIQRAHRRCGLTLAGFGSLRTTRPNTSS